MLRAHHYLAITLLACACGTPPAAGQRKNAPAAESKPTTEPDRTHSKSNAKFDFYVLSISWSPQYCASKGGRPGDIQCAPGRLYDFVLHGLWPQYEKGWPQDCTTEQVDRSLANSMLDIMPSPTLVRHEWAKHGTCSGLDQKEYFSKARSAFQRIRIPEQYKRPKLQIVSNPSEMRTRFVKANPGFPEDGFAVACSGRFLQEVRACLTTDFEPRSCSKDVLRGQCRTDEIILRPVR